MNDIATIFSLRRNLDTGKLQLDSYQQFNLVEIEEKRCVAEAVAALEGKTNFYDPMVAADIAVGGMKLRAKMDGAITGVYGFKGDQVMDRHTFWDHHKKWPLTKFKEMRI